MKSQILFLLLIMCSAVFLWPQGNLSEPPGKLEVAKHPLVLEPPTGPQPQKLDFSKAQQQAAELNELARSVQIEVDQSAQGKLPKDLPEKLKQIEKISKKLRAELVQ
jgi:hypothetical protein